MTLCGIFVGGQARRMGGQTKGLLPAPESGEPLVVRLSRLALELGCEPVLVGAASSYRSALPTLRVIDDRPPAIGPLGGLLGLLEAAGTGPVLALACDLPFLSRELLGELLRAPAEPLVTVLAPRADNGLWEPLCARYDAGALTELVAAAIGRGVRSFQALFAELTVRELPLSPTRRSELIDWDTPEDVVQKR